jgi:hypothetical protein
VKRIVVIGCVAAVVMGLLAATAYAVVKQFQGPVDRGGNIRFSAEFHQGKPTKAGLFDFRHIPVKCDDGHIKVNFSTQNVVSVTNRKFHYTFHFVSGTARVDGVFNQGNNNKAHGTVKYGPSDVSGHPNCRTPTPRDWTATH